MKTKIICVFGTRPDAIKMAPVVRALRQTGDDFVPRVVATAQHRHMLDQVLRLFQIRCHHDLDVMEENQTLDHITTAVLARFGRALDDEKPDLVLTHGDTTTAFAATLAAFHRQIPVGHVEAGLRSHDKANPFPEEANRLLTDALCTLHFAPTHTAQKNLLSEGIHPRGIFVTGNTVIDALYLTLRQPHDWKNETLANLFTPSPQSSPIKGRGRKKFLSPGGRGEGEGARLILVTAHRRENFGAPLLHIFRALRRVAEIYPDVHMIYPVHLNPNVQRPAKEILSGYPRIHRVAPLDYGDLVNVLKRSVLVVTDSGGLQEEAPALGKPVLVLRKVTERPEAVQAGTVRVIGVEEKSVFQWISRLLEDRVLYRRMASAVNPYGDGQAAERTVQAIRYFFGRRPHPPAEFRSP